MPPGVVIAKLLPHILMLQLKRLHTILI